MFEQIDASGFVFFDAISLDVPKPERVHRAGVALLSRAAVPHQRFIAVARHPRSKFVALP